MERDHTQVRCASNIRRRIFTSCRSERVSCVRGCDNSREAGLQARRRHAMTISTGPSAFARLRMCGIAALLASGLLSGCGTLPTPADRQVSSTPQASAQSPLVKIAQDSSPAPTLTGFRLMPLGFYSLDARIQLARRARSSLDVQYYLIQNDRTGRLLMR